MKNILSTAKALLGITDDSQDAILALYADIVVQGILNVTNRLELPAELELVAAQMVEDMHREAKINNGTAGNVSSVSEAGRSVSFDTSQISLAVERRIKDRKTQLNRFKLPFRLGR